MYDYHYAKIKYLCHTILWVSLIKKVSVVNCCLLIVGFVKQSNFLFLSITELHAESAGAPG